MYSIFGTPIPSKETIASLRKTYPKGQRVVLVEMGDAHAPKPGTEGTVERVDDLGTIHISWDNGSTLGAVYGMDYVRKI